MSRKYKDLAGETVGKLTILRLSESKSLNSPLWICKCSCGTILEVRSYNLTSGKSKSCGCSRRVKGYLHFNWTGFGEISGNYWSSIRKHAEDRNLIFDISKEDAMKIFENQNRRCALSGQPLTLPFSDKLSDRTASLDRIDSSKGYIVTNIQWVHKKINIAKGKMPDREFIEMCQLVASWNVEGPQ